MSWDPKVRQPEDEAHTRSDSQLWISCVDRESFRGYLRLSVGVSAIHKTTAKAAVRLPSLRDRCHCAAAPFD